MINTNTYWVLYDFIGTLSLSHETKNVSKQEDKMAILKRIYFFVKTKKAVCTALKDYSFVLDFA